MTEAFKNAPILIEVSPDLAQFIIKNCNANLDFALRALIDKTVSSPDLVAATVTTMELFKELKAATEAALAEHGS